MTSFSKVLQNSFNCDAIISKLVRKVPKIERSKSILDETLKWGVYFWDLSQNIAVLTPVINVINPKLGQKGLKLVFHVPMVKRRWKSIVKGNPRWSIRLWNHYLKILKLWLPVVINPKKGKKNPNRYFMYITFGLSPFAQDIQIWAFFDPILASITSELGLKLKFEKPVLRTLCLKILILLSPFVRDGRIRNFLDQTWVDDVTTRKKGMGRHQDFVIFKNCPEKWVALLKYCIVIDFHLSITIGT